MKERVTKIPRNRILSILLKNRVVSRDCRYYVLCERNKVNINAWTVPNGTHHNLGDLLSFVVVEHMCALHGIDILQPTKRTKHLYAIGSVLLGHQDLTVWGSGFICDRRTRCYFPIESLIHRIGHKTDIRAVRGPESRDILLEMGLSCPEIYGDPAVLLPLFYHPKVQKTKKYLLIPHFSLCSKYSDDPNLIGTFTRDWRSLVDVILSAELVISSSLHGIILAEAYGIPTVMLCDTPTNDIIKYRDYYYSTGRYELPIVSSVEEALKKHVEPLDSSVLKKLQDDLIASFPADLWADQ